jgi:hypothetical protein
MSFRGPRLQKAALLGAAFLFALAAGCSSLLDPRLTYDEISARQGFNRVISFSGTEELRTYLRRGAGLSDQLAVYIEGDGAQWPWPDVPPRDPTPTTPLVLHMAAAEPAQNVAYVARPCQFLSAELLRGCPIDLWTTQRFSLRAADPINRAIDRLKEMSGATRLRIVGYSGGGTMAAQIALLRDDVDVLITAASPLNPARWAQLHGVSALGPDFDLAERLLRVKPGILQIHLVGEKDTIVPPELAKARQRDGKVRIMEIPGFDHDCCWRGEWPRLLAEISSLISGDRP